MHGVNSFSPDMTETRGRKPIIPVEKRWECLALFSAGHGYKSTARMLNLNKYTVRNYLRRYKAGDITWAEKGQKQIQS